MQKKVLDYLLRKIDDYLSYKWVMYEGDKYCLKVDITCGTSQGLQIGPIAYNVIYDDFLLLELPIGTSIIGFAYDGLVVCAAEDVKILELRIIESLRQAKRRLDSSKLKMGPENRGATPREQRARRGAELRRVSAYRTVSTSAVLVLPIKTRLRQLSLFPASSEKVGFLISEVALTSITPVRLSVFYYRDAQVARI